MNLTVFVTSLFALQLVCLFVASQVAKRMTTQKDYFLAGKGIRFFPLLMTLIATQIGGGLVLGSAEEAYQYGWSVILYPIGASLGLLLLASGIGRRLAQFPVSTVAQIFEVAYGSPRLKRLASALSIISLFLILIAQVTASKKFMFTLGVGQEWIFLGFWSIVIVYTVLGGLHAVVATDVVQAAFFVIIFILCFLFATQTQQLSFSNVIQTGLIGKEFEFDSGKLLGWLLMPLLFMVIEQDMAQRCFAAKSGRIVSLASGCAALCIIFVCMIPVYFGVLGKTLGISVETGSSVLMTVIQETTNPIFTALIGSAILAAIISTADSLINAITSNMAQDFLIFNVGEKELKKSQIMTACIALLAVGGSYYFNNVVNLLIQSYELSVVALFVPIFVAIFRSTGSSASAACAIGMGVFGFGLFRLVPVGIPKEMAALLLSALGFLAGELVVNTLIKTKKLNPSPIEKVDL